MNVLLSVSTLLVLGVTSGYAFDLGNYVVPADDDASDYDSPPSFQKRSYYSPACARCLHNPSDYATCESCFGRQAIVPFYGGYAKRVYDPSELDDFAKRAYDPGNVVSSKRAYDPTDLYEGDQKRAYDPSDLDAFEKRAYNPSDLEEFSGSVEKRGSFLYCKCCTVLKDKYCCNKCPFRPFYEGKRSYETSFHTSGSGCIWCNAGNFDFYGCLSCSRKRK